MYKKFYIKDPEQLATAINDADELRALAGYSMLEGYLIVYSNCQKDLLYEFEHIYNARIAEVQREDLDW